MTLPSATPQPLAALAPVEAGRIATQVLHKTDGGSAAVLAIAAGGALREHTNPSDALVVVVEGGRVSAAGGQGEGGGEEGGAGEHRGGG